MRRALAFSGLLALCLASAASAQVTLQAKHPEGTFKIVTTNKVHQILTIAAMDVETSSDSNTTLSYVVEKPQADGTVRVRVKTEALTSRITLPGAKIEYDSSKPDVKNDNPMLDAILDAFRAMKGATYTVVYGKDGKVAAIEGTDKIIETAAPTAAEALKQQLNPETLKRSANQDLAVLPDGPVKKGDQWKRTEVNPIGGGQTLTFDRFYEYQGTVEMGGKTLDKIGIFTGAVTYALDPNSPLPVKVVNSDLKIGNSLGTILFDRERGEVVDSSETLQITGTLTLSVNGMELPGKLNLTFDSSTVYKR